MPFEKKYILPEWSILECEEDEDQIPYEDYDYSQAHIFYPKKEFFNSLNQTHAPRYSGKTEDSFIIFMLLPFEEKYIEDFYFENFTAAHELKSFNDEITEIITINEVQEIPKFDFLNWVA